MSGFVKTPTERELEILRHRIDQLEKRVEVTETLLENNLASPAQPASEEQERGDCGIGQHHFGQNPMLDSRCLKCSRSIAEIANLPPATAPRQASTATPAPPNTDSELESANRNLANALGIADPAQRIGVYDYNSLVECLRSNFQLVFPGPARTDYITDPQNMIQLMAAEIQHLRSMKNA